MSSPGMLVPQTWTYRDRPGQTFQGGKAVIAFDADCRAPGGFSSQLDRVAAARVLQPNIDYRTGKDGRLVKLADLLPRDTAARALFKQPREDFPLAAQALVPQGRGRRYRALWASCAARPRRPRRLRERRDEGGQRVGGGERRGRGREGGRLDRADDERAGRRRRRLRRLVQAGPAAGQVHAEGRGGGRQGRQGRRSPRARSRCPTSRRSRRPPTAPSPRCRRRLPARRADDRGTCPPGASDPAHPLAAFELGRVRLIPVFGGMSPQGRADRDLLPGLRPPRLDPATGKANASAVVSHPEGRQDAGREGPAEPDRDRDRRLLGRSHPPLRLRARASTSSS